MTKEKKGPTCITLSHSAEVLTNVERSPFSVLRGRKYSNQYPHALSNFTLRTASINADN